MVDSSSAQLLSSFGESVTLVMEDGASIYPLQGHPQVGDDVWARGTWSDGVVGSAAFSAVDVYFNIKRVRGVVSGAHTEAEGTSYTLVDGASGQKWTARINLDNLDQAVIHGNSDAPRGTFLNLPDGTGVDVIGYLGPDNTIIVSWIEAHPPSG